MKSKIRLFLALCLLGNGFSPRMGILFPEHDTLAELMANQPIMQCCFALSTIPLKIVSKLLSDGKLAASSRTPGDQRQEGRAADTSSEFSITASPMQLPGNSLRYAGPAAPALQIAAVRSTLFFGCGRCRTGDVSTAVYGKILILLMIFAAMLSRGGLDKAATIYRNITINPIRCIAPDRVFNLPECEGKILS